MSDDELSHEDHFAKYPLLIGDVVKVVRKAKIHEREWRNSWVPEMDAFVGHYFKVESVQERNNGIRLAYFEEMNPLKPWRYYDFPCFCLMRMENV